MPRAAERRRRASAAARPRYEIVPLEEMEALIRYTADRGLDPSGDLLRPVYQAYRQYLEARGQPRPQNATASEPSSEQDPAGQRDEQTPAQTYGALLQAYGGLCAAIYPRYEVNGKTILDSEQTDWFRFTLRQMWLLFAVLALGTEILDLWAQDALDQEGGPWSYLLYAHLYGLDYLSPFFWGGLGSCVYLAKRLSDETAALRFDKDQFRGPTLRIALGAVLGGTAVVIYDRDAFVEAGLDLDANVIAFLAGIFVKIVYGALERTIELVSGKLGLEQRRDTGPMPYRGEPNAPVGPGVRPGPENGGGSGG